MADDRLVQRTRGLPVMQHARRGLVRAHVGPASKPVRERAKRGPTEPTVPEPRDSAGPLSAALQNWSIPPAASVVFSGAADIRGRGSRSRKNVSVHVRRSSSPSVFSVSPTVEVAARDVANGMCARMCALRREIRGTAQKGGVMPSVYGSEGCVRGAAQFAREHRGSRGCGQGARPGEGSIMDNETASREAADLAAARAELEDYLN